MCAHHGRGRNFSWAATLLTWWFALATVLLFLLTGVLAYYAHQSFKQASQITQSQIATIRESVTSQVNVAFDAKLDQVRNELRTEIDKVRAELLVVQTNVSDLNARVSVLEERTRTTSTLPVAYHINIDAYWCALAKLFGQYHPKYLATCLLPHLSYRCVSYLAAWGSNGHGHPAWHPWGWRPHPVGTTKYTFAPSLTIRDAFKLDMSRQELVGHTPHEHPVVAKPTPTLICPPKPIHGRQMRFAR